jgi:Na+(H+)/acetate symporter ActP
MKVDLWVLAISAITVVVTIWMGFWSARRSRTASDFFVAGRSVSVGWNASAISGEYLSAASFMGVAGMVMSAGYDALWYPVCYACGYLFLLLFIAGPLRRFGAYTIPDFAEGRFDSPVFRKIAVVFVLFIGFFYTMPQMKGAGTALSYIFQGLPYPVGVVLVGAVITLNVALGGMKGITLVQAFQYWAKMFAISVPIFVLMAVYGPYGTQLRLNRTTSGDAATEGKPMKFEVVSSPGGKWRPGMNLPEMIAYARKRARQIARPRPDPNETFPAGGIRFTAADLYQVLESYGELAGQTILRPSDQSAQAKISYTLTNASTREGVCRLLDEQLAQAGVALVPCGEHLLILSPLARTNEIAAYVRDFGASQNVRQPLPEKAPKDAIWIAPFGPLTTKAAKAAAAAQTNQAAASTPVPFRAGLGPDERVTVNLAVSNVAEALTIYADLTSRQLLPRTNSIVEKVDELLFGQLSRHQWIQPAVRPDSGVRVHGDGLYSAREVKETMEAVFKANGISVLPVGDKYLRVLETAKLDGYRAATGEEGQKAWLGAHQRPLALLYTYSLIVALVCGTAGLPHILVRFYTNPDGVAAKRTTMWVMILIGVFYVFPPVFGVMGRNLMPELYNGLSGVAGTDGIVLRLPTILRERFGVLGSILSGVTCAGAFAAFMSTFSGLLVSMTGAMAHDVYGRILRPKSTPQQRLRMFRVAAVGIGAVAIGLGTLVENFEINFMVGQAFAIAASSYFPLLFMAVWWRRLTMRGAAAGMLTGGSLAVAAISLTSYTTFVAAMAGKYAGQPLPGWLAVWKSHSLEGFWAHHPLFRILCEQPALWAVPTAIVIMIVVSKLTRSEVPADIRMKMLVLHAPEKLGLKHEYVQDHGQ